eukprot:TRINITY_DN5075_c2_g7_i1.p1 TRINITY_DN5075_c2_g7~~TRINITY_DN5075_c2_g7_i1.p1  ORF type:complete len:155 (-),score=42.35 TRINITY_DN5075_c2_g7_i1:212-619(-)
MAMAMAASCLRGGLLRLSAARFAPKKAKGKAPAAGGAAAAAPAGPGGHNQLFNIYAGREDEKIMPDEHYPAWLWDLEKPRKGYGELAMMFIHGVGIEDAQYADYQRFLRQHRKLVIKINNLRLKKSKKRPGLKIA